MKDQFLDYELLTGSPKLDRESVVASQDEKFSSYKGQIERGEQASTTVESKKGLLLRRGHFFSYIGLFLFTTVVYFRPYEFIPAFKGFTSMAFWVAVVTLAVYVPSQLAMEGNLTSRIREVHLVLVLGILALISVVFADDQSRAWNSWLDFAKVLIMFVVMVNVVRTQSRLKGMLLLALAVSVYLSLQAYSDLWAGIFKYDGYRLAGSIGNMFQNPNDLALQLVTMVPLAVGLGLTSRLTLMKAAYWVLACIMVGVITLTYSRGGFIGLVFAIAVLAWRLGKRSRFLTYTAMLMALVVFIMFAPGGYGQRISDVVDGSAVARQNTLKHSLIVMLRFPLFGVGIDNYVLRSDSNTATHNAYTQVGADMGIAAMVVYIMILVLPLKRLREIERETFASRRQSKFYFLAVGLQASLIGYMACSFFASVSYLWYGYYLVGYAICLHRMYLASADAAAKVVGIKN